MHPLRLPICPKSFRTACYFQPRKLFFCSPFCFEGDKPINERLFTQLYFKLFSIICQTFLNGCKILIFCNLKISFLENRTAKSGLQVKLYAPLNYRTLRPLIYNGFRSSIWLIFYSNECVFYCLVFATENSLCGKSKRKIGATGQTIRTPRLPHFQSLIYQRFQNVLFLLFKTNKRSF